MKWAKKKWKKKEGIFCEKNRRKILEIQKITQKIFQKFQESFFCLNESKIKEKLFLTKEFFFQEIFFENF